MYKPFKTGGWIILGSPIDSTILEEEYKIIMEGDSSDALNKWKQTSDKNNPVWRRNWAECSDALKEGRWFSYYRSPIE